MGSGCTGTRKRQEIKNGKGAGIDGKRQSGEEEGTDKR